MSRDACARMCTCARTYARARTWVIDLSHLSHLSQAKEKQAMTGSCGVTGCVTGVTGFESGRDCMSKCALEESKRPKWGRSTTRKCKGCGAAGPSFQFPKDKSGHVKAYCSACVARMQDRTNRAARERLARQSQRRAAAARAGKLYIPREERRAEGERRAQQRQCLALHDAHVRVFRADKSRIWRWRYRFDEVFRAKERARIQARKARILYPKLGDLLRSAVNRA